MGLGPRSPESFLIMATCVSDVWAAEVGLYTFQTKREVLVLLQYTSLLSVAGGSLLWSISLVLLK